MFLCLFDDAGKVTTTAVLHENIKNAGVSVNVSVVIPYYVFVI